jgi:hypothetical protein
MAALLEIHWAVLRADRMEVRMVVLWAAGWAGQMAVRSDAPMADQ